MKNSNFKKLIILYCFATTSVWAASNEDDDLSFLPPTVTANAENVESETKPVDVFKSIEKKQFKFTLDNTLQSTNLKDQTDLVFKLPVLSSTSWTNLTRVGMRSETALSAVIDLKTDILLNAYTREGESFNGSDDLRLDIKEAYLSWQKSPTVFFDVGRINIKNGVATGFNPTDYFKVGTVLDRNTEDVSQLRDARLGALLVQAQTLWQGGSLSVAVAPKVNPKTNSWTTNKEVTGLNLHKSNDRSRALLKLTQEISDGFSPELLYYNEAGHHNVGLNLSKVINKKWFAYGEWNIGKHRNLMDEALLDTRKSAQLSPMIAQTFAVDKGKSYQQQVAIGASYSSESNITTKVEYHFNQAGLSKKQADNWFALGLKARNPAEIGQLLSVRSLAQARGEPLGKHSLFIRSSWADAGMDDVDLTGLLLMDLNDKSFIAQAQAAYELNNKSEVSLRIAKYQGNKKSLYGSLGQDYTASLLLKYDF
ncbi:MAG: hypothetical protein KAG34_10440 [Cocleimonas sp.]|nr:hypothetical protein [Cocleimonas sp.]